MKKITLCLFVLSLVLTACSTVPETEPEPMAAAPFAYHLEEQAEEDDAYAPDGQLISMYNYYLPRLVADEPLTAEQQASVDAFNAWVDEFRTDSLAYYDEEVKDAAEVVYPSDKKLGIPWNMAYFDSLSYTANCRERSVALRISEATHTGGAHPISGVLCRFFDLTTGEWLTAEDLTDDLPAFQNAVAESILTTIAEQGLAEYYFDDYETTVRTQNPEGLEYDFGASDTEFNLPFIGAEEGAEPVIDGIVVCFQDYTIGPHAAGMPSFFVPSSALLEVLNERALTLLDWN